MIQRLAKKCKTLNQIKQLHAHLLKTDLPQSLFSIGPLFSAVAISKDPCFFSYARMIFDNLTHKNTFMYNTMIRGYMQADSPLLALFCYLDMLNGGFQTNNYTYPPVIKACSVLVSCSKIGRLVHAHVVEFGFGYDPFVVCSLIEFYSLIHDMRSARMLFDKSIVKDVAVWTAMIDGYGKIGAVEDARELFEKMPQRNALSWSAMMAAYSRISDFKEVISLFREMQERGTRPNESVLVTVLTACAHLGTVTQGFWVHSYAKRYKLDSNLILATALVDMYSKCGYVESALSVFEGISRKDAGAWNAVISGVAMNGDARKSLQLFERMIKSGTKPTETTFVAVLTSCTHAKRVEEGIKLFKQMKTVYGVEPQREHYACVVDLLARAGKVEEAEKFIEGEIGGLREGDANVWGALLGACRIYGNAEVGNRVWKKLVDMGINDYGIHVLSYNLYKEAGQDMEAKRVRKLISDSGMKKIPGCSVIEVNGAVEEFLAGDTHHPKAPEIYKIINSFPKMDQL